MFEEIVNIVNISNQKEISRRNVDSETKSDLISRLPSKTLQKIICDITKQSNMNTSNRTCYCYNDQIKSFVQQDKSQFNDNSLNPIIIEYYNEMIFFEMIHLEEMVQYLYTNIDCNYVIFPVFHGYHVDEKETTAHISMVVFDNVNKLVFHLDSNGWSENKKKYQIEKLIESHINMANGFGLGYAYIESKDWNPDRIYLNVNYHHQEIHDGGNCMLWTILLIKMLQETKRMPEDLFDHLEKLDYEEKVFILKILGDEILCKYNL